MDSVRHPRIDEEPEIDLRDMLDLFRRKRMGIVLALVLGGLLSGAGTYFFIPPKYEATAKLYIVSAANDAPANLVDLQIGALLTADYKELVLSRPVLERVVERLHLDVENVEELRKMITVSNPVGTRVLSITAVSESPQQAQEIANELARLTVSWLPEIMEASPPNLAEEAVVPEEKAGPSYVLNTALGAAALAALYCGAEAVRFVSSDAIRSGAEFERCFGIAPLACVPEEKLLDCGGSFRRGRRKGAREA